MMVPVSLGEVVDKVTILDLKIDHLNSTHALTERRLLASAWESEGLPPLTSLPEFEALSAVNSALWDVEERLRAAEQVGRFDDLFVTNARAVYRLNDRRAELKKAINLAFDSEIFEVKSYGVPDGHHQARHDQNQV